MKAKVKGRPKKEWGLSTWTKSRRLKTFRNKIILEKQNLLRLGEPQSLQQMPIHLFEHDYLPGPSKATTGYWYVFRLSVRIASFLVWWLPKNKFLVIFFFLRTEVVLGKTFFWKTQF